MATRSACSNRAADATAVSAILRRSKPRDESATESYVACVHIPHFPEVIRKARVTDGGKSLVKRSDNPFLSPLEKHKALGLIGNSTKPLIERPCLPTRGAAEALDMACEHAAEPALVAANLEKHRIQNRILRLSAAENCNLCAGTLALQQQIEKA